MKSLPRNRRLNLFAYVGLILIHVVTLAHKPTRTGNLQSPTEFRLDPNNPDFQVIERGPHHALLQRIVRNVDENGQSVERLAQYTTLGGGLNYFDSERQEWIPSQALIEPFEGGAVARQGQTKVIFAPTLGDPEGTVDILTPDGQRLRSVAIGLAYYDPITGDDVILSEVNPNVKGQIVPPNQVIYPDAFTDIHADIVYEYRKSGFSQNVVLHQQPPDPALIGFSRHSRLEVLTEFLEAPEPQKNVRVIKPLVEDSTARNEAVEPDLLDEELNFGTTQIGMGRAFNLGARPRPEEPGELVVKRWNRIDGRQILFEGVEYQAAAARFGALDPAPTTRPQAFHRSTEEAGARGIPERAIAHLLPEAQSMVQMAQRKETLDSGYLIDYEILTSSITDFVFESGKTYWLDSSIACNGTTTFEGGAVIKYGDNRCGLDVSTVSFLTSPYQPVTLTSMHDDTVGEIIAGSTGTPSSYQPANGLTISGTNQIIENVRIRHLNYPIWINNDVGAGGQILRNIVIQDSYLALVAFGARDVELQNAIIDNTFSGFYTRTFPGGTTDALVIGTNITMHDVDHPINGGGSGNLDELKNTLIVGPNPSNYTGKGEPHNVYLSSSSGVFEPAGGGNFYLASGSPYRDLGTSNIDAILQTDLESRTTFPPSVFDGPVVYTTDLHWTPHVPRDNDGSPDLGYHYPAVDYLVHNVKMDQTASLTVDAGTQIGLYGNWGVIVADDARADFNGTATAPINIAWYGDLQDSVDPSRINGSSHIHFHGKDTVPGANQNELNLDYTYVYRGSYVTSEKYGIWLESTTHGFSEINIRHSRFDGMTFQLDDIPGRTHRFFNNAFLGGKILFGGQWSSTATGQGIDFRNNLVLRSKFRTNQDSGADLWVIQDNLFHELDVWSPITLNNSQLDYNGYVNTNDRVGGSTQPNDVVLTSLAYESGPFGDYYQPTSSVLIDAGSRLADAAGLLHHTVLANGQPEGTSTTVTTVDIGLHYPAVDNDSGVLLDSDWDGFPNILEDPNGNGTTEAGESLWKATDSPHVTGPGSVVIFNLTGSTL